jgi:hypothetical protein
VYSASPEEVAVQSYEKAGAERTIFALPSADRETVLPLLDKYTALLDRLH